MDKDTMLYLFESDQVTGYLTLQKLEVSDEHFLKILAIKPSDLNTIFARVVSLLKEDEPQKTKKELINDILEILERSPAARQFVGIGVKPEYNLLKGFPVRKGDPYEHMPEPGTELQLKPSELYIGWTTDGSKAREDAVKYDASKGDPIGGLLVDVTVDVTKLLFDVNAVIKTVKSKYKLIETYNQQAAPGKALSKSNTKFLATDAPLYSGKWEIVTTNKVVNSRVIDKWTWDTSSGEHKIKWVADAQKTPPKEEIQDTTPEQPEVVEKQPEQPSVSSPEQPPVQENPAAKKLQERIMRLFESAEQEVRSVDPLPVYEELMDEAAWQGMKNFFAKTFGTLRGKKMKFLETLKQFYVTEKEVYTIAKEFASLVDKDPQRLKYAEEKINSIDKKLEEVDSVITDVKSGINIDDIPNIGDEPQEPVDKFDKSLQSPEEAEADKQHADVKDIKSGGKSSKPGEDVFENPPIPGAKRG
jgi:hypothetical protein